MKKLVLILAIIGVVVVSGCLSSDVGDMEEVSTDPQERCVQVCREQLEASVSLNDGPCLSEMQGINWAIEDWVCDVAHNPRKTIDDSAINQCQRYRTEKATHFVEVTPNCEFIRKA